LPATSFLHLSQRKGQLTKERSHFCPELIIT